MRVGKIGVGFSMGCCLVFTAAICRGGWSPLADGASRFSATTGEYLFPPNDNEMITSTANFTTVKNNSSSIQGITTTPPNIQSW